MAARCAGCLVAISKGEPFVIADTEVFHNQCAADGAARRSVGTKLRVAVHELRGELARAQADAAEAARLRTAIDDANRDARKVRAERDTFERNLNRVSRQLHYKTEAYTLLEQDFERMAGERDRVRAERDRLIAERDRLVAEATARDVATVQAGNRDKQSAEPELDDAAQRFRLLELDPLE